MEPEVGQMPVVPRIRPPYLDRSSRARTGLSPEVAGQIAGLGALAIEVAPDLNGNRFLDLLTATGNQVGNFVIPGASWFSQLLAWAIEGRVAAELTSDYCAQ